MKYHEFSQIKCDYCLKSKHSHKRDDMRTNKQTKSLQVLLPIDIQQISMVLPLPI